MNEDINKLLLEQDVSIIRSRVIYLLYFSTTPLAEEDKKILKDILTITKRIYEFYI